MWDVSLVGMVRETRGMRIATSSRLPLVEQRPVSTLLQFDGGALGWLGGQLAGFLVTICTLGICYPWAVVMTYRWKAAHTLFQGRRLRFTGSAFGLFGLWIKWLVLIFLTVGIYGFWVYPRLIRWTTGHQAFAE